MEFKAWDLTALPVREEFDLITLNAVLYCLDQEQLAKALKSCREALKPGGSILAFDLVTDFPEYRLEIREFSPAFPGGHSLNIRSSTELARKFADFGFEGYGHQPFTLPIDLPRRVEQDWLVTYTVRRDDGERMAFRGCLYQPWSFVSARKPMSVLSP